MFIRVYTLWGAGWCEEVSHAKGGDIGIETAVDRSSLHEKKALPTQYL